MQRFTTLQIPESARGATVAIGNFDGVHLGHQKVLEFTKGQAGGAPFGVMTFEPHPRSYFADLAGKDMPPFRLMSAEARANRLEKLNLDVVFEMPFDTALSQRTPRDFCQQVIVDALGLKHVIVGQDFCFGRARSGNVESLSTLGAELGFGVTVVPLQTFGDRTISSTNIRKALAQGDPRAAAKMLGHWHRIDGPVVHGEKRGRELGYPTANMSIDGLHPPAFGVYVVTVDVLTGPHVGTYGGAASIGVRPMFGENRPNCETFVFDFTGDLYGETLSVGLVDYLRGEEKFYSLDALITQMNADCAKARDILGAL